MCTEPLAQTLMKPDATPPELVSSSYHHVSFKKYLGDAKEN